MKRVWPIVAVADVPASAKRYMALLGAEQTHPVGTTFDQVVGEDGTVLLCLHHWGPTGASGTHQWPTLLNRGSSDENGLLLWFVVDDFARAWERAKGLGAAIEEEPNTDNGTGKPAFVTRDLDGYHVAVNESWAVGAPDPQLQRTVKQHHVGAASAALPLCNRGTHETSACRR